MILELELIQAENPESFDGDVPPVRLLENPYGLVSLWDMLQVHAVQFQSLIDGMSNLERHCDNRNFDPKVFGLTLGAVAHDSKQLDLVSALKQIDRISHWLESARKYAAEHGLDSINITPLSPMISELRVRVHEELEESVFFHIAPSDVHTCFGRTQKDDFTAFIIKTPEDFFGANVVQSFGSSAFDISEACHCIFTARSTACVFHLMRVLEIGLAAFAKRFAVPCSHTNWHNVIEGIEKGIRNMSQDPAKAVDWKDQQEFFSQAATHFMFLKDAWRNYTAHARGKYTEGEARTILDNVRAFMQKLATRLHE